MNIRIYIIYKMYSQDFFDSLNNGKCRIPKKRYKSLSSEYKKSSSYRKLTPGDRHSRGLQEKELNEKKERYQLYKYKKEMNTENIKTRLFKLLLDFYNKDIKLDDILKYIVNYCDGKNNEEKEGLLQQLLRYYPFEIINTEHVNNLFLTVHIGGMYTYIHCLLFPNNKLRDFNIDDFIKTLDILLNLNQSPFYRNKLKTESNPIGETSIEALNISIKNKFIPNEYYDIIYNKMLHPPNKCITKIIKSKIAKLSPKNINKICNYFYWCMIINPDIFIDNIFDQFSMTGSLLTNGKYIPISDNMKLLYSIFQNNPIDDVNFNTFFKQYPWSPERFTDIFENKIMNIVNIESMKDPKDLKYVTDIFGAIIGEIRDKKYIKKYIFNKFKNSDIGNACTCICHSGIITDKISSYLITNIHTFGSRNRYLLDMAHKDIRGESILKPGYTPVPTPLSPCIDCSTPVPPSLLLCIDGPLEILSQKPTPLVIESPKILFKKTSPNNIIKLEQSVTTSFKKCDLHKRIYDFNISNKISFKKINNIPIDEYEIILDDFRKISTIDDLNKKNRIYIDDIYYSMECLSIDLKDSNIDKIITIICKLFEDVHKNDHGYTIGLNLINIMFKEFYNSSLEKLRLLEYHDLDDIELIVFNKMKKILFYSGSKY